MAQPVRRGDIAYPGLNRLRCELLAEEEAPKGLDNDQRAVLEAALSEGALRTARDDASLWDFLTVPDAMLVEKLADGDLAKDEVRATIRDAYLTARKKGSAGEFRSALEEIDFILLMIPPRKKSWKALREAILTLKGELE